MAPWGRCRRGNSNGPSSGGNAAQPASANNGNNGTNLFLNLSPSQAQHHSGSQDSMPAYSSQVPMSVDGNGTISESKDNKIEKARLTVHIQRQEKVIALLDPSSPEDASTLQQCRQNIEVAKEAIIAFNPPQDQLRNLQSSPLRPSTTARCSSGRTAADGTTRKSAHCPDQQCISAADQQGTEEQHDTRSSCGCSPNLLRCSNKQLQKGA